MWVSCTDLVLGSINSREGPQSSFKDKLQMIFKSEQVKTNNL